LDRRSGIVGAKRRPDRFLAGRLSTTLSFEIPHSSFVVLRVYDLLGREVATLVNEMKQPGTYSVQWKPDGLASGVYLYRLQAGEFIAKKKLVIIR